jgi:hypothetical protein
MEAFMLADKARFRANTALAAVFLSVFYARPRPAAASSNPRHSRARERQEREYQ